jgi:6-pyruvoyltetrahydropterin/6-carboxytetrahydropterin synthase
MIVELSKDFTFEAAHRLPEVPEGHKCHRLHGHTFEVTVVVKGPVDDETGWLMDYADIENAWRPIHEALDHRYLNEIDGLSNPTSEILAGWIWERLESEIEMLDAVVVKENCISACTYRGESA